MKTIVICPHCDTENEFTFDYTSYYPPSGEYEYSLGDPGNNAFVEVEEFNCESCNKTIDKEKLETAAWCSI